MDVRITCRKREDAVAVTGDRRISKLEGRGPNPAICPKKKHTYRKKKRDLVVVESEVDEGSENRSVVGQFAARALEEKHYVTAEGTAATGAKFGTEVRTVEEASRRPTWAQVAMRGSVRATTENKRVVSRSLS